jgi:hypothetical protein
VAEEAQRAIVGTENSLNGAAATARNYGITAQGINEIFQRVGNTAQARMVCSLLGTTPEALKADAERIVGGSSVREKRTVQTRFPRLK